MINLLGVAGSARHILHILIYHEHNCHLTINIVTLPITSIEAISPIGPLHKHLRSNVHPSVAILLEDKQTTGHCTKHWEISGLS